MGTLRGTSRLSTPAPERSIILISSIQKIDQFRDEGYVLFEDAISPQLLEMLREECAFFVRREDEKMDKLGVDQIGITHRNKRYHAAFAVRDRPSLGSYLFSDVLRKICEALVGPDAFLFFDGFVVKGAEGGMKLAWLNGCVGDA